MVGSKIKCVFCDLDGTLIPASTSFEYADSKDIKAVNDWIISGGEIVIATGRDRGFIDEVNNIFNSKLSFIASNGACIIHDSKELYSNTISVEKFSKFWESYKKIIWEIDFIATKTDLSIVIDAERVENHYTKRFLKHETISADNYIETDEKQIYKISIFVHSRVNVQYVYEYFAKHLEPNLHVYISGEQVLEIVNHGVNKWDAIQRYCQLMEYENNEIVVIGDEDNDFEMIANAQFSFAMSTGKKHVIDVATYVVDNVAEVFNKYIWRRLE